MGLGNISFVEIPAHAINSKSVENFREFWGLASPIFSTLLTRDHLKCAVLDIHLKCCPEAPCLSCSQPCSAECIRFASLVRQEVAVKVSIALSMVSSAPSSTLEIHEEKGNSVQRPGS